MAHSTLYTPFLAAWLAGFTVCLSLIVSIGAQNLYVLRQAVHSQHVRACVAWCVASDALLIGLGVAGMARLLAERPDWAYWLGLGGVLFMLAYGLFALWRMVFAQHSVQQGEGEGGRSLWRVVGTLAVITLFNPHVYLDTVLLVGSIGARQEGDLKWVFVAGAASASALWFAGLSAAGRRLKHWFAQPLAWRILDGLTGAMMLSLAWWVWQGLDRSLA
ncbi:MULTISPECIES: LysE/ArgO family amino acid transporter [Comamonas]|jgi:L-lysine exporter family protein LysE/ArgO|uniref:Lysine transporter LysE n=1 Tax=Comamonas terrigena TaxID=32013 RepID=A0A2A7UXV0_COMTR|nr:MULTISPECIES: LysE family transporter [Comamonas]MBD9530962.1 LysE family transporter [Comamonas sp. CMM01]MDH0049614.1 LysE family transporter [Comamonas terrigena]MDH0511266.1 LysE family transporter [Comamonas terrigena]MDH1091431.1 LysE family transporter [Comamonas terrigena]MDH1501751.1 LysE family transporter [Comamonas terrigena]